MAWFTPVFVPGRGVVSWPGTSPFYSLVLVGLRLAQLLHAPDAFNPVAGLARLDALLSGAAAGEAVTPMPAGHSPHRPLGYA
mgnify:CR=1 FL=1